MRFLPNSRKEHKDQAILLPDFPVSRSKKTYPAHPELAKLQGEENSIGSAQYDRYILLNINVELFGSECKNSRRLQLKIRT